MHEPKIIILVCWSWPNIRVQKLWDQDQERSRPRPEGSRPGLSPRPSKLVSIEAKTSFETSNTNKVKTLSQSIDSSSDKPQASMTGDELGVASLSNMSGRKASSDKLQASRMGDELGVAPYLVPPGRKAFDWQTLSQWSRGHIGCGSLFETAGRDRLPLSNSKPMGKGTSRMWLTTWYCW